LIPNVFLMLIATAMSGNTEAEQTVLSLGDSYTIGEGVVEAERWPMQMAQSLREQGIAIGEPKIVAKTGWTTDELKSAIDEESLLDQYDWVTLLVGVNNQYRGREVDSFREEFRELLQFAIRKAGNHAQRVIVLSIPDWGVTPFAEGRDREEIARQIDLYNQVKKEETDLLGCHFIDITDITRQAVKDPKQLLAEDGLHPSSLMYAEWAKRAVKVVTDSFNSR
jgi:lysophospholipase L1-like esterase